MAATASNQPSKANQDSMGGGEVETSLEQLEALKQKLVNQLEEGEVIHQRRSVPVRMQDLPFYSYYKTTTGS